MVYRIYRIYRILRILRIYRIYSAVCHCDVFVQVKEFVLCASQNEIMFSPPTVRFVFANGVTRSLRNKVRIVIIAFVAPEFMISTFILDGS